MVRVSNAFNDAREALKSVGIENYKQEASLLIEKVTGIKKYEMIFKGQKAISDVEIEQLNQLLERRKNGEPLQYILGEWEFYGLNFKVGKGVLIPRQDTEALVDEVLQEFIGNDIENPVIADLCSGSGCIAVTLEKMIDGSKVFAIELSDEAILYLSNNIAENNSSVEVIVGDVLSADTLQNIPMLDCIVSNPPYLTENDMQALQKEVTYEPETALRAGSDGLDFYRGITQLWKDTLKPQGFIAFECGINQHNDIKNILESNGFENICFQKDLCGIIRVVTGKKIN